MGWFLSKIIGENAGYPCKMSLSLNERAFVKKAMLEGLRTDKRPLDMHRELHFEFGQDRGHVIVHLGHTKYYVICHAFYLYLGVGCWLWLQPK